MGAADRLPVVVIGAGIAGLLTALALRPRPVTVLAQAPLGQGASTGLAQGGIAAAVDPTDHWHVHVQDTVRAGAGLVDPEIAALVAADAASRIEELGVLGVAFDRDRTGELALGLEAAHRHRRIVHAGGDRTGARILAALVAAAEAAPSIAVVRATVCALATDRGGVAGVWAVGEDGRCRLHRADAVVLATGGLGGLYEVTTNPPGLVGAGIALAARAGARLADLEFVQFHPTGIVAGRDPVPLASEALRGAGAVLVDQRGHRFMRGVDPRLELAPRDVVARAIHRVRAQGGEAYLDAREAIGADFPERFPGVLVHCLAAGIDPRTTPIPVAPAAHYHMGGVVTDRLGRTSVPGLWACGEVACTGLHGANRLASNSLLEGAVFASRVARDVAARPPRLCAVRGAGAELDVPVLAPAPVPPELRRRMQAAAGLERDHEGLADLLTYLEPQRACGLGGLAAWMVAAAAWLRRESRGSHFRRDHPGTAADRAVAPARATYTLAELEAMVGTHAERAPRSCRRSS